jgi:RHS repeat-associated protein
VQFEYDALGRRTVKTYNGKVTRWVWDGNTPLHEWTYDEKEHPKIITDEFGLTHKEGAEPVENVTTWVFEEGSFRPAAKLTEDKKYSIIADYLGTPVQMYNEKGKLTWEARLDIYGKVGTFAGSSLSDCPFRYQGKYHDAETDLYYNRFRYYDPDSASYLSQDPIGLVGNNPTFYGYVKDLNSWVDVFGLDVYELRATVDGWYPVYEKGQLDPTSYKLLRKGELYKIGESQMSSKRYSSTRLAEARINKSKATSFAIGVDGNIISDKIAGLRMNVIDSGGTKQADQLLETQKLKDYMNTHGELPAGNKTCH